MKKIYTFFTILFFISITSCSKEIDDNSNGGNNSNTNNYTITPPSWIQGRWILEYSAPPVETGFYFTEDDFGQIAVGQNVSQVQMIENIINSSPSSNAFIEDEETSNSYKVTLNSGGGDVTYTFDKQNNTEITWEESSSTNLYIKE